MEVKKNPKFDIGRNSIIFFQLGMIFMLFLTWQGLEWKTINTVSKNSNLLVVGDDLEEIIPITEPLDIPPPPPKQQVTPTVIIEVENELEIEESIIQSTEADQNLEILDVEDIIVEEVEDEIIADVPFAVIENVPIYPGCESVDGNIGKKKCLSEKVEAFIISKFNTNLAGELGLEGRQRIYVKFRINRTGNVVDVMARAPHPKLEEEAVKIVSSLPKMSPGKQRGVAVGVSYSLPIVFDVRM